LKGIDHPINLYEIVGIEGKYKLSLAKKTPDELIILQSRVPIPCFLIEEKIVSEKVIQGHIIRLGAFSAEVILEKPIESPAKLKILLAGPEAEGLSGIYAKVSPFCPTSIDSQNISAILEFTWPPEDFKRFLVS
jgi:adenylate cyclase